MQIPRKIEDSTWVRFKISKQENEILKAYAEQENKTQAEVFRVVVRSLRR